MVTVRCSPLPLIVVLLLLLLYRNPEAAGSCWSSMVSPLRLRIAFSWLGKKRTDRDSPPVQVKATSFPEALLLVKVVVHPTIPIATPVTSQKTFKAFPLQTILSQLNK